MERPEVAELVEASRAEVAVAALCRRWGYPVQVEQGYAALVWLFEHADEVGVDPSRIGILGISAGGNLAAAVALKNRDLGNLPVRLQLLEVPVVDLTGRHLDLTATRGLGIPRPLAMRELRSVARTYLSTPDVALEPYASPLRATSHEGLPPAVILTAEYDPLRDEGEAYGEALRSAGNSVTIKRYDGMTHVFFQLGAMLEEGRQAMAETAAALRLAFGTAVG